MENWRPGEPLVLETENYILRSLGIADITPEYISWWSDPELQGGRGQKPQTWQLQDAQAYVRRFKNRRQFHLGIFPRNETLLIGHINAYLVGHKVAQTGIVIGNREYWGRRVPLEVRARLFEFLFRELGMQKIKGTVMAPNHAAIFNYKAQGFTCEGILREEYVDLDGIRQDKVNFGLLREEWMDLQKTGSKG